MKDSYYFPHDYHARHDPKLEKLRMTAGCEGLGIYWCLIEMLYEENGYLKISEIPYLSKSLNTTEEVIKKVIENYSLFKINDDNFYSESLLERLKHINDVREKRKASGSIGGSKRQANAKQTSSNIKERKGKEIKEINTKDLFLDFVLLTPDEYQKLVVEFGTEDTKNKIANLNAYIGSKGIKYKSHYFTILNWSRKELKDIKKQPTMNKL